MSRARLTESVPRHRPVDHDAVVLEPARCWELVRSATLGRLAVIVDAAPEIFPINFVVDHATVVFRSASGTKTLAAHSGVPVALEVDHLDPETAQAWSVMIKGSLHPVREIQEVLDSFSLPLYPWPGGAKNFFLRIVPSQISGRRFVRSERQRWEAGMDHGHRGSPE